MEESFPHLREEELRVKAGTEPVRAYYQANDLHKAASTVAILQKLKPEDGNVLYAAHRIYPDLADEAMLTVEMVAPKSARMRPMMAEQSTRRGNVTGATLHFREALEIDPNLPGAHFELGEELSESTFANHVNLAEQQYKTALVQDLFNEKAECRVGAIDLRRSELERDLAHYTRALKLQPNDSDANLGAAEALLALGEIKKAEHLLLRANCLDRLDRVLHYRLAMLYRKLGRSAEAGRGFEEFERLKN